MLDDDVWGRWRWHIALARARGELALLEGKLDDAWRYAEQSFDIAVRSESRKHVARAQLLQGQIQAASGRVEEAIALLSSSADLAGRIHAARDTWFANAALGKYLTDIGRERAAEERLRRAAEVIESIAASLTTAHLRETFLAAEQVCDVYTLLGSRPPE
jgi:hypothetical protein